MTDPSNTAFDTKTGIKAVIRASRDGSVTYSFLFSLAGSFGVFIFRNFGIGVRYG